MFPMMAMIGPTVVMMVPVVVRMVVSTVSVVGSRFTMWWCTEYPCSRGAKSYPRFFAESPSSDEADAVDVIRATVAAVRTMMGSCKNVIFHQKTVVSRSRI